MSYSFDGANDRMTGTFTGTYALPVTLAVFLKLTDHPAAVDEILTFGNSSSSQSDSVDIRCHSADNTFRVISTDSAANAQNGSLTFIPDAATIGTTYNATTGWFGLVGTITSSTLRDVYAADIATTGQGTVSAAVASALQFVRLGENMAGSNDFTGLIAEAAIWDSALSTAQITQYLAGVKATSIGSPIGYWPFSASNATQSNDGSDTGGDLTVTGATFSSDHPTITTPSSTPRLMLLGVG